MMPSEISDTSVAQLESAPKHLSLSAYLKQATAEIHAQIEHGSKVTCDIVVKVPEDVTAKQYRDAYRQFLRSAYGFEGAVIRSVHRLQDTLALSDLGYEFEAADAAELIQKDLAALTGERDGSPAVMHTLPKLQSVADLAGLEYVRRGSRNGNAFIAHVVRRNLNLDANNGAAFLNMDTGQTKAHWDSFKLWLDSLDLSPAGVERAVATAIATFAAVGEWHKSFE